ncbi:MAG: CAP domain-containing protein [Actinomycetota bacterium]
MKKSFRITVSAAVLLAVFAPAASAHAECLIPLLCQLQSQPIINPPAAPLPEPTVPAIQAPPVTKPTDPFKGLSVPALENVLLTKINAERAIAGLPPLARHPWADGVARAFSEKMAAAGTIWHNMDYMATGRKAMGANALGENVAWDWTLTAAHVGLMNSPSHRVNILADKFTHVGIGIALTGAGQVFVTQDFAGIPGGAVALKAPAKTAVKATTPLKTAASAPVVAPAPVEPQTITLPAATPEADEQTAAPAAAGKQARAAEQTSGKSESSPLKVPGIAGGVVTLLSSILWGVRRLVMLFAG